MALVNCSPKLAFPRKGFPKRNLKLRKKSVFHINGKFSLVKEEMSTKHKELSI